MELCERETIILLNKADRRDGFFTISTNCAYDAKRVCKRLNLTIPDLPTENAQGNEFQIKFKIPMAYHSRTSLEICKLLTQAPQPIEYDLKLYKD